MPVVGRGAILTLQPVVVVFGDIAKSVEAKRIDSVYGEPVSALIMPRWILRVCRIGSFSESHRKGRPIDAEAECSNYTKRR